MEQSPTTNDATATKAKTTIQLDIPVRDDVNSLKTGKMTQNDVVKMLIGFYREHRKEPQPTAG